MYMRLGLYGATYRYYDSTYNILALNTWQYVGITYDYQAGKFIYINFFKSADKNKHKTHLKDIFT
jgi:hypothetical protein